MPIIMRGLAWLAAALSGLFPVVVDWFARWITKKTLYMAAYYAAYAALTAAIFSTLNISITALAPALPTNFHIAVGLILPSNAQACFTAMITAEALRWVYDYQVHLLNVSTKTWANL